MSHPLSPEVVKGSNAILVDPERQAAAVRSNDPSGKIRGGESVEDAVKTAFASGLLEISEIAFDTGRRYAVLSFSFSCGMLCGHSGTVVFEKVKDRWKRSKRRCNFSISRASLNPKIPLVLSHG